MGYTRTSKSQTATINDEKMSLLNRIVRGFAWFFVGIGLLATAAALFISPDVVKERMALGFVLFGLLLMVVVRISHNTEVTAKALKDLLASLKNNRTDP